MSRLNIIIDTDIGDDIDDALAIAFALKCPELNVAGITTVFGHTAARAQIAAGLLAAADRSDIPVHAGCGRPLNEVKDLAVLPCQYMAQEMAALPYESAHAVDYMIERIMRSPEPVAIVAIGPLTNVAVALLKESRLREKLERVILMGGAYYFHFIEWNIKCDPEAARIVFESGVPISAVGLDVTKRCLMTEAQLSRLAASESPVAQLLWDLIRQWRLDTGRTLPILHDALAVYGAFGGDCLTFEQERVAVELAGVHTRGMTWNLTDRDREEQLVRTACELASGSPIRVAKKVDSAAFGEFFFERLLADR